MNILPKKSWHVLSRDNILRVRRDEAEARAVEEDKQRRIDIAEREARLELMRKRARAREGNDEDPANDTGQHSVSRESGQTASRESEKRDTTNEGGDGHINFFADMTQGVGLQLTNPEHESEKKQEQEKFEKRIGLLNYLVDKDKADQDPWYAKQKRDGEESAKCKRRKELMDPLTQMQIHLSAKRKSSDQGSTSVSDRPAKRHSSELRRSSSEEEAGKPKKTKKLRKADKLEELRRQRRQREEAERSRAETLLLKREHREGGSVVTEEPGRYNSQFNPHLARQSRH